MNKANIFLTSGWIGLAGGVFAILTSVLGFDGTLELAGSTVAVFACWAMLFTRNADEYTRGLWTSAASVGFGTVLILFLALPFSEGVYDGFQAAAAGADAAEPKQDIPAIASITIAIGAFYAGLFWKRLRGA